MGLRWGRKVQTHQRENNFWIPILVENEKSSNFQSRVPYTVLPCEAYGLGAGSSEPNGGEYDENVAVNDNEL